MLALPPSWHLRGGRRLEPIAFTVRGRLGYGYKRGGGVCYVRRRSQESTTFGDGYSTWGPTSRAGFHLARSGGHCQHPHTYRKLKCPTLDDFRHPTGQSVIAK